MIYIYHIILSYMMLCYLVVVQEERCRTMCPGYEDGLDGAVSIGLPATRRLAPRRFGRVSGAAEVRLGVDEERGALRTWA